MITLILLPNRHGKYNIQELKRILKSGGMFHATGWRWEWQGPVSTRRYRASFLKLIYIAGQELINNGFDIIGGSEAYRPIEFYDVGALVWFARIIDWESLYFEVKIPREIPLKAQKIIGARWRNQGKIYRYYFVARESNISTHWHDSTRDTLSPSTYLEDGLQKVSGNYRFSRQPWE